MGGHTVLSSARRAESLALAASVEHLEASIVDFLCRRIVDSGPSLVLKQAVKGSRHGRESGNVELRPSCRSYCRLPMSSPLDFQCQSDAFGIDFEQVTS